MLGGLIVANVFSFEEHFCQSLQYKNPVRNKTYRVSIDISGNFITKIVDDCQPYLNFTWEDKHSYAFHYDANWALLYIEQFGSKIVADAIFSALPDLLTEALSRDFFERFCRCYSKITNKNQIQLRNVDRNMSIYKDFWDHYRSNFKLDFLDDDDENQPQGMGYKSALYHCAAQWKMSEYAIEKIVNNDVYNWEFFADLDKLMEATNNFFTRKYMPPCI